MDSQRPKRSYKIAYFNELMAYIQILLHDKIFTVGQHIVERIEGDPMGGSFSEVGTCIDLNYCIEKVDASPKLMKRVGMYFHVFFC